MKPLAINKWDLTPFLTEKALAIYNVIKQTTFIEVMIDDVTYKEVGAVFLGITIEGVVNEDKTARAMASLYNYLIDKGYVNYGTLAPAMRMDLVCRVPNHIVLPEHWLGRSCNESGYGYAISPVHPMYENNHPQLCMPEEVIKRELFLLYCYPDVKYEHNELRELINKELKFNVANKEGELAPVFSEVELDQLIALT